MRVMTDEVRKGMTTMTEGMTEVNKGLVELNKNLNQVFALLIRDRQ
jgi:hypothetical protein